MTIGSGVTFDLPGNGAHHLNGTRDIDNFGTITLHDNSDLTAAEPNWTSNYCQAGYCTITNEPGARIVKIDGAGTAAIEQPVDNTGALVAPTGTLKINGPLAQWDAATSTLTGGTYAARSGGVLQIAGLDVVHNAAAIDLQGAGSALQGTGGANALRDLADNQSGAALTLAGGPGLTAQGALANAGTVEIGAGSTLATAPGTDYTQTGGSTVLTDPTATLQAATVQLTGGTLGGQGTVDGSVVNAGTVAPGPGAGALAVTGDYQQTGAGSLDVSVAGTTSGQDYAPLDVTGAAALAGTLSIVTDGSYTPAAGDTIAFLTYASQTGAFDTVSGQQAGGVFYRVDIGATGAALHVVPTLADPPGAPRNVAATAGDATATVTFDPPASDGGAAITGYTVTAHPDGAADSSGDVTAQGSASPITLAGLTDGTLYDITVVATNAAGDGPASSAVQVTPAAVPDTSALKITAPAAVSYGDQITVRPSSPTPAPEPVAGARSSYSAATRPRRRGARWPPGPPCERHRERAAQGHPVRAVPVALRRRRPSRGRDLARPTTTVAQVVDIAATQDQGAARLDRHDLRFGQPGRRGAEGASPAEARREVADGHVGGAVEAARCPTARPASATRSRDASRKRAPPRSEC